MTSSARPRGRPRKEAGALPAMTLARGGLHEQAALRLKDMIIRGRVPAGSILVETELSVALGVSRTPLRDALKLLASEGLVELRPNRSARVPDWDPEAVLELFEALAGIERLAAELAAARITQDGLAELRSMQAELDRRYREGQLDAYFALNQDIHGVIVSAAANRPLRDAHQPLQARAQWARLRALSAQGRWDESAQEHRALLAALEARDAARAGSVAADHVLRTGVVIADVLRAARGGAA